MFTEKNFGEMTKDERQAAGYTKISERQLQDGSFERKYRQRLPLRIYLTKYWYLLLVQ